MPLQIEMLSAYCNINQFHSWRQIISLNIICLCSTTCFILQGQRVSSINSKTGYNHCVCLVGKTEKEMGENLEIDYIAA